MVYRRWVANRLNHFKLLYIDLKRMWWNFSSFLSMNFCEYLHPHGVFWCRIFLWLMASTRIHLQFLDFVFVLASGFSLLQFSLLIMQQLWTDLELRSSKAHYLFICNLRFSLQEKLYKFSYLFIYSLFLSRKRLYNWITV